MTEPTITCPQCQYEIKLTESLAAPLIEATRHDYEQRMAKQNADVAKREAALRERQEALDQEKEGIEDQVAEKLTQERAKIVAEESKRAKAALATDLEQKTKEITDLQVILQERDAKLEEAQKAQAELIRAKRALDDAKRELDLTIEKRVQDALQTTRDQARREAEEALKLRVAEKEQTIASMHKQIEELKRKAEQGSQQLQGEVQELELEALLTGHFPMDIVSPVPKGEFGGDLLQIVVSPLGQRCGTILWESKRTKNWSDGWLPKLRDDQRAAKAEIAVLVSQKLPKDIDTFHLVDGVWVTNTQCAIPVALCLRESLIELATARQARDGQDSKTVMVYEYLTGPRFRQRVQAIAEAFSAMEEDLARERKAIMKQWAKREEQISRVIQATVGMYGDLQGIAGKTLTEIEGLDITMLENDHAAIKRIAED